MAGDPAAAAVDPGGGPAAATLAGHVGVLLAARPELASQVHGMLPHCGLTLIMSRQRRAAAEHGERILPADGLAADNEPRDR